MTALRRLGAGQRRRLPHARRSPIGSTSRDRGDGLGGVFAPVGRQADAGGLEDGFDLAFDASPAGDGFAVLFDHGLLQPVEIAQERAPLGLAAGRLAAGLESLAQDLREEGAENVPWDGGIRGVID